MRGATASLREHGARDLAGMGREIEHGAVGIFDSETCEATVIVDRFATVPIYFTLTSKRIAISDSLQVLADHTQSNALSPQALLNYVYFHNIPSPLTVYSEIQKLEPGHAITVIGDEISITRHWTPTFTEENAHFDFDRARSALMTELDRCVAPSPNELSDDTGAFLSGGLDSSTVAGVLSQQQKLRSGDQAATFSIGFEAAEAYNELPFARVSAEHFDTQRHEYLVTPNDVAEAIPIIANSYAEPFGNSSAVPTYFCAKLAKASGFNTLLAGDGGDELFAGNERYLKQLQIARLAQFTFPINIAATILKLIPIPVLAAKAQSLSRQIANPLPDRLQDYNFIYRLGAATIFEPAFLDQVRLEQPLEMLRDRFHEVSSSTSMLNSMLYLDWKFTLADNDLPKVVQMCRANGVEVRFPLLRNNLVDFSLTVPDAQLIKGRDLRHFYRRSMHGFLATETLNKSKHGFGLPFGLWLREEKVLRVIVEDSLRSLQDRGIFRTAFLQDTARLVRQEHAGYYGELAWILMTLEQWFQANHPNYRFN